MALDRSVPARDAGSGDPSGQWHETTPPRSVEARAPATVWRGLVVALVLAAVLGSSGHVPAAVGVVLAGTAAGQMTALAWSPWLRCLDLVERAVATGLRTVLLGIVFVVVVCPLWLLARLFRHDTLAVTTRTGGRPPAPTRPFARERSSLTVRRRLVVPAVVCTVLAIAIAGAALVSSTAGNGEPRRTALTRPHSLIAHEGLSWAPALFAEESELRNLYDPYLSVRQDDHQGRYINIVRGVRQSYRAETAPGGDALDVWFFGGSTLFGIGQRDDHTIPSEIVRLAEHDGLAIRAWNFGMSTYVNWQETVLLLELLQERPPPDLVVFYDGANDATVYVRDGTRWPSTFFAPDIERALIDDDALVSEPASRPDRRTEVRRVRDFLRALAAGARTADSAAAALGVPVRHFLQPVLGTKRPLTGHDEDAYDVMRAEPRFDQARWDVIRAQPLPEGLIDVTDALDGVTDPVYFDQVHTNELGAAAVARAMYVHLRPVLERLGAPAPG